VGCLAPDLPGHGRSVDLSWTSLADVAGQVADVIAATTADGRACVVPGLGSLRCKSVCCSVADYGASTSLTTSKR
jgi:hypothetical protein